MKKARIEKQQRKKKKKKNFENASHPHRNHNQQIRKKAKYKRPIVPHKCTKVIRVAYSSKTEKKKLCSDRKTFPEKSPQEKPEKEIRQRKPHDDLLVSLCNLLVT
jgi:hypothetical protein